MKKYLVFCLIWLSFIPLAPVQAVVLDIDEDGLPDQEEMTKYFTDPFVADTDGDGFNDGEEVKGGYSPRYGEKKKLTQVDSDKDSLNDAWELKLGTGLMNTDSDKDSFSDGTEVMAGYDPLSSEKIQKEKLIQVSLKDQELSYTFGGIELERFKISSGLRSTPTPAGEFEVLTKRPVVRYAGANYNYPNTKWNLHFAKGKLGGFYIHGAYWHNKFGQPMSHGCVNVSYENMERLYNFAQVGTEIVIQ